MERKQMDIMSCLQYKARMKLRGDIQYLKLSVILSEAQI